MAPAAARPSECPPVWAPLCGHWRTGGTVSSQASSEQRMWQDAGGKGGAEEWGSEACPWCSPSPIHPPCGICSWGSPSSGQCHCSSPPETQQAFRNGGFTLMPKHGVLVVPLQTLNPFFSFSLPPLPTPCQHPFDDSSSTSSRFPPVHLPLRQQNRFCQPHFYPPSTALQVPTCLNSFQLRSLPGLCTCRSLCQATSSPVPPVQCQFSLRLQCWEAVLSVPSRWEVGPVWVPCRVSPGIPCCD